MPERWERELERFTEVDLPDRVRTRMDEGPSGDGVPPLPGRRQRVVAGIVAFAVFAGAAALALGAFGRDRATTTVAAPAPEPVTFMFEAIPPNGGESPSATMTALGSTYPGAGSSYTWSQGDSTLNADTFGSELTFDRWFQVVPGAPVAIGGDADTVKGWVDSCCNEPAPPSHLHGLDLTAGAAIPLEEGRYILEFTASWPQGTRTFYFPIDAKHGLTADDPASTLHVVCDQEGTHVDAPFVRAWPDGVRIAFEDQIASNQVWFQNDADGSFGGSLARDGETKSWSSIRPGPLDVSCGPLSSDRPGDHVTVVDPEGLWIPVETSCPTGTTESMTNSVTLAYDDPDPVATIRAGVSALQPADQIVKPGYPATAWKTPVFSVLRDGVVVASVDQTRQFHVVACAGSGIAAQTASSSGSLPAPTSTITATLDAPDDGSMPGLTLMYGAKSTDFIAQGGTWPGVNAFILPLFSFNPSLSPGSTLSIAGDATSVTGHLEVLDHDLRQTGETIPLDLGSGSADLPTTAGSYRLSLTGSWPRGTASFYVVIDIGDVAQPSTTPTAQAQTLRALLEGTASQLACSDGDRVPIGVEGNVIDQPAGESYVRVNITGILQSDVLQHTEIFGSTQGYWTVTRDGNVVAVVADPQLQGLACRGSGIGGA